MRYLFKERGTKMIRKCLSLCLVMAVSAVLVGGCGGDENVDPYAEISLRQATYGPPVISKGYKYKLVNPDIVSAAGHLCLVREGNVTSMISGRSIADKIEAMDKSDITFNVVKEFSPYVHFRAEEVYSGADTVFISSAGTIFYPTIKEYTEFKAKDYDEINWRNLEFNNSANLKRVVDEKFHAEGKIKQVDEEGEMVWMVEGGRGTKFRVDNVDDALLIALRLLPGVDSEEGADFVGGITFAEIEEWADRRSNQISGTVTIEYLKYGDLVFSIL
jgi:hypothetical protein